MKPLTKIKGAFKLSAIGDALGWITEFEKSVKSLEKKYDTEVIDNFLTWEKQVGGRFWGHNQEIEAGSYSDDTQLTLSVARSIRNDSSVDHEYFAEIELPSWLEYARGAGRTIKTSARKIQRKSASWDNNFYSIRKKRGRFNYTDSGANGAAMRILPIALVNIGVNLNQMYNDIFANSIVTHGHPRAIVGALLHGLSLNKIILYRSEDFDPIQFLTQLGNSIEKGLSLNQVQSQEIKDWANRWTKKTGKNFRDAYDETIQEVLEYLRLVYAQVKNDQLSDQDLLKKIGCYDPATSGSGVGTVVAGIYFTLKYSEEPKKAIIKTVNSLGTDTDSIAAFTGGLLGALHGHNIIPEAWKQVQDIEYLDKIAEDIHNIGFEDDLPDETISFSKKDFQENKKKAINLLENLELEVGSTINYLPLGQGEVVDRSIVECFRDGKDTVIYKVQFEEDQLCTFSYSIDKFK